MAEKDEIFDAFYKQGKLLGMSDEEISLATVDAIRAGKLPAIAERAVPLRDGKRPIFLIPSLPPQLADSFRASVYKDKIKVSVRELKGTSLEMIENGQLAVLRPGDSRPELLNNRLDWPQVVIGLESEIRRPF